MIACLLVPSLALACELQERPSLAGQPVALTDDTGLRVVDATRQARERGVQRGMSVREALAYYPPLAVLEPHPARVVRVLDRLARALRGISPLVETPPLDEVMAGPSATRREALFADLRGTERLFPADDDLAQTVFGALAPARSQAASRPREGAIAPRLALAEHRFTAYAAARRSAPWSMRRVDPADAEALLTELSAAWLPLDAGALDELRLLGIDTLGAFTALPRHAVEARFGTAGGRAWMAARGIDPEPVHPDPHEDERVSERAQAEPPLVSREAVLASVEQLLGRALRHRRAHRRFVRCLRLRAVTEDDRLWERRHVMKEPTGDRHRLWTAIRPLLEHAEYPGPVAELELELAGLTAESGRQSDLFEERTRRREHLDEMVRHLKLRYGRSPLARVVAVEPWHRLPERRHALMDYEA